MLFLYASFTVSINCARQFVYIYLMCRSILPAHMYVLHMRNWRIKRPEEGISSLRNRVSSGCELLCECWESSWSPVDKHPVASPPPPPPPPPNLLSHLSSLCCNVSLSGQRLQSGFAFVSYLVLILELMTSPPKSSHKRQWPSSFQEAPWRFYGLCTQ
jgi:hypothetical protein